MAARMDGAIPAPDVSADWIGPPPTRRPSFGWTHGLFNRLITLSDVVAMVVVAVLMLAMLPRPSLGLDLYVLALNAVEVAIFVTIQQSIMGYRFESYLDLAASLRQAAVGLAIASVVPLGGVLALALIQASGGMVLWFFKSLPLQFVVLGVIRVGARAAAAKISRDALMRRDVVLIGEGAEAAAVIQSLTAPGRASEFRFTGTIAPSEIAAAGVFAGWPLLGGLAAVPAVAARQAIDLVVIVLPLASMECLAAILDSLHLLATDVVLVLDDALGRALHGSMGHVAGHPVITIAKRPLKGSQAINKFIEDRVICGLVFLAATPLLLAIAIAIRLDSPGPALFRQNRVGLNGRIFRIFKFRTMTVDTSDDGTVGTTEKFSARITRVGRFLRATSLDELAQLFNVVLGDMSVVGPRPYVPGMLVEGERFEDLVRNFRARYRVKPGITGLAQSNGIRSNALRNKAGAIRSVQQDLHYIAYWSLIMDIQIIVRTVLLAMSGPEVF
jgi:exopolysaccharide biosynthesis polyprenyl glycosylphosphotransferase